MPTHRVRRASATYGRRAALLHRGWRRHRLGRRRARGRVAPHAKNGARQPNVARPGGAAQNQSTDRPEVVGLRRNLWTVFSTSPPPRTLCWHLSRTERAALAGLDNTDGKGTGTRNWTSCYQSSGPAVSLLRRVAGSGSERSRGASFLRRKGRRNGLLTLKHRTAY